MCFNPQNAAFVFFFIMEDLKPFIFFVLIFLMFCFILSVGRFQLFILIIFMALILSSLQFYLMVLFCKAHCDSVLISAMSIQLTIIIK